MSRALIRSRFRYAYLVVVSLLLSLAFPAAALLAA